MFQHCNVRTCTCQLLVVCVYMYVLVVKHDGCVHACCMLTPVNSYGTCMCTELERAGIVALSPCVLALRRSLRTSKPLCKHLPTFLVLVCTVVGIVTCMHACAQVHVCNNFHV